MLSTRVINDEYNVSAGLLNVVKGVLRSAVKLGIEEAGTRICGSAWPVIKQVMTPVVDELEKRYPQMLLVDGEMEKAQADLASDPALAANLHEELIAIKHGHREIITLLARHDETLQDYRDLIVLAVRDSEQKNQKRHETILDKFANLESRLDDLPDQINKALYIPGTSLDDIYTKANGYQADAMTWITAGKPDEAEERLNMARSMALSGLASNPNSTEMMTTLGFVEKSQAQVCELRRDAGATTDNLALAAKYFVRAVELDKTNLNALHGMANIYYFSGDYDSAIQLEYAVFQANPDHGPALNDLGLALEGKLAETTAADQRARWANFLIEVYKMLEQLMPRQPQIFPANYLAYVQRRRAELEQAN